MNSLTREIHGATVLPLDSFWHELRGAPIEDRLALALELAGCKFHEDDTRFVREAAVSVVGIGGLAIAGYQDSDETILARLKETKVRSEVIMGSSAGLSYLNSADRLPAEIYRKTIDLGHYSVAHTVQVNMLVAGLSEGAELELSLQRDLVHLSKLTNARTKIQNQPPIVVRSADHLETVRDLYDHIAEAANQLRTSGSLDELEQINGLFPVNKATLLMLSGDLSNMRKLVALSEDTGKESEFREILGLISQQLKALWPELFANKETR